MTIYEINRILSSENKSKLITHFWSCNCEDHDVSHMVNKLSISQSNLSKHIGVLLNLNVLKCKQIGKTRFYSINKEWKKKWTKIVEPQVKWNSNKNFACSCSCSVNKNKGGHNDQKI